MLYTTIIFINTLIRSFLQMIKKKQIGTDHDMQGIIFILVISWRLDGSEDRVHNPSDVSQ